MSKKGLNITKRKDGRWEARVIQKMFVVGLESAGVVKHIADLGVQLGENSCHKESIQSCEDYAADHYADDDLNGFS